MTSVDVIDEILGPHRTAAVEELRAQKPELAVQVQDYYDAVFIPGTASAADLIVEERLQAAIRTAAHTVSTNVIEWYSDAARVAGVDLRSIERAGDVDHSWDGNVRMTAMMRHVDLVTAKPVAGTQVDIKNLADAGFTPGGIVALSQVIAYVSYQLRLIAALRALGESR